MKIIDDESKKIRWWNRNYFFAGTVFVVLLNIIIHAADPESSWFWRWYVDSDWDSVLSFGNLAQHFVSAFLHSNWQHCLLNMLCFFICGAWLERRKGTLPLLGLVFVMAWIAEAFVGANALSTSSTGYSGVNYAFYAYAIIDYGFLFIRKSTRTKINIITGAVLMALIYFAACFAGGTSSVTFKWYPYDFMHNMGHYSAFFSGALLAITVQLIKLIAVKERKEQKEEPKQEKQEETEEEQKTAEQIEETQTTE